MNFMRADWPVEGVIAGTTERAGGASCGSFSSLNLGAHVDDDPAAVRHNRSRLRAELSLPDEPVWLNQSHSARVVHSIDNQLSPDADALVTRRADTVCAILTADCLPVLFSSRDGSAVGAAHAGWRGLLAGILENTVAALGVPPQHLCAWLGPAISKQAFEVGDEVRDAFLAAAAAADEHFTLNPAGRWQADLYGLARQRLLSVGVSAIFGGNGCTYGESDRFFSYRRDGACGRMASLIWRVSG